MPMGIPKHITIAKLKDGKIVEYDACADKSNAYNPDNFKFIGRGIIHSVDGVKQSGNIQRCFFVKLF